MMEFREWYYGIPFFTRYWLSLTLFISLMAKFNFLHAGYLVLNSYGFFEEFQLWRPITALFFYQITPSTGIHFLMNCYFLYIYSEHLENGMFAGKPADYFTMLYFNWLVCTAVAFFISIEYLMDPMVMSVLYVWCQLNKDVVITFWFTQFRAMFLPWVLLVFNIVINEGGVMEFNGILIGHLAFLVFKYPEESGGRALLTPPGFLFEKSTIQISARNRVAGRVFLSGLTTFGWLSIWPATLCFLASINVLLFRIKNTYKVVKQQQEAVIAKKRQCLHCFNCVAGKRNQQS